MWRRRKRDFGKGVLAGLVGGLVASFMMNQFQAVLAKVEAAEQHDAQQQKPREAGDDPATVQTAVAISEAILHRDLKPEEKARAGNAVHYTFGALTGAAYGVAAEASTLVRAGSGTLFGTVVWLGADEVMVPLLGLSKGPQDYPVSAHLWALAAHLIYGLTTELVRRGLRAL